MEDTKRAAERKNPPNGNCVKESMRIQKTEYVRQQMKKRKEAEDALLLKLMEEQRIIDRLQEEIRENLEQTEESGKYNQELKESINAQIYALHGVSKDKLEGMREYRHAYYRGCACAMFFLSAALVLFCGALHGFQSEICMFMLSFTGMEGALLAQEKKRVKALDVLFRLLDLLIFPVMLAVFVCYELEYPEYELFLPYMVLAAVVILIFASASFFLYNPYRGAKKKARDAREHIEDMEKSARKEVRKNKKSIEKELKKQNRRLKKEEKRGGRQEKKKRSLWMRLQESRGGFLTDKGVHAQDAVISAEEGRENAEVSIETAENVSAASAGDPAKGALAESSIKTEESGEKTS